MPYSRPVEIAFLQAARAVWAGDIPRDCVVSGVSLSPGGGKDPVPSPPLLGGFAALASREPWVMRVAKEDQPLRILVPCSSNTRGTGKI